MTIQPDKVEDMVMTVRMFLRRLAPDFMWCTAFDLFVMYEQINEAIEWDCFKQSLHQLYNRGRVYGQN